MKNFEIFDAELGRSIGVLLYYEGKSEFIIELQKDLDEWTAPLLLTGFVKKGVFTIPRDISFLWVKERVIPSGRQNIGAILDTHKLKRYDEMKFLEISKGKCSQDHLFIKEIPHLPDYVIERQMRNLLDVSLLDDHMLLCFFADETVKKVDLAKLIDQDGVDKVIRNEALYQSGKIGIGGYAVTFNDSIDIPAWLKKNKKTRTAPADAAQWPPRRGSPFPAAAAGRLLCWEAHRASCGRSACRPHQKIWS